jgi:hypothetical protein
MVRQSLAALPADPGIPGRNIAQGKDRKESRRKWDQENTKLGDHRLFNPFPPGKFFLMLY